jgi:hypothetical protein
MRVFKQCTSKTNVVCTLVHVSAAKLACALSRLRGAKVAASCGSADGALLNVAPFE